MYNNHHTLLFDSWVVTIFAPSPNVSHQDCVFSNWLTNIPTSQPFQILVISIMNMVGEGWDWSAGSEMSTTTWFSATDEAKVGHFWHQGWVCLDWFGQFSASQPFHWLIVSMMNGFARLRFEFNTYNNHHTPAFEASMATRSAPVPYFSHQDGACLDWFKNITASQPFQHLTMSMMNGWRWWRLLCGL